jgi:hypothetical protein
MIVLIWLLVGLLAVAWIGKMAYNEDGEINVTVGGLLLGILAMIGGPVSLVITAVAYASHYKNKVIFTIGKKEETE